MKSRWAQPSLSRDFTVLSAAILFVLCIISLGVTYSTYASHTTHVASQMENESLRIEEALNIELENANYILNALGKEIVMHSEMGLTHMAQIIKTFDNQRYIYSIISWASPQGRVLVGSRNGILETPINVSDRDYIQAAAGEPWKMIVGSPIEGRLSNQWIIPVAMGITDNTGRYLGTIIISINIDALTGRLRRIIQRDGLHFAIISKSLVPITKLQSERKTINDTFSLRSLVNVNFSTQPSGVITRGSPFFSDKNHAFYRASIQYPYVILLAFDPDMSDMAVRRLLWSRLLQIGAMAIFFVCFLWIARTRMIAPVQDLTNIASQMVRGDDIRVSEQNGPMEIERLGQQINRLGDYIDEQRRIQNELRSKILKLRTFRNETLAHQRSQTEFLAYVCQEMRNPLNHIIGGAQVMKDQLYGPIENRKYRQYAQDIFSTSNTLMDQIQQLQTVAKIEAGYIDLNEKPVDIASAINKALRFASDKMQAEKRGIKVNLQEPLPRLFADEFRFQQILMNLLLYSLTHTEAEDSLMLEARIISQQRREQHYFVVVLSNWQDTNFDEQNLLEMVEVGQFNERKRDKTLEEIEAEEQASPKDTTLSLVKALITLHNGTYHFSTPEEGRFIVAVFFPGQRIRTVDTNEN